MHSRNLSLSLSLFIKRSIPTIITTNYYYYFEVLLLHPLSSMMALSSSLGDVRTVTVKARVHGALDTRVTLDTLDTADESSYCVVSARPAVVTSIHNCCSFPLGASFSPLESTAALCHVL